MVLDLDLQLKMDVLSWREDAPRAEKNYQLNYLKLINGKVRND